MGGGGRPGRAGLGAAVGSGRWAGPEGAAAEAPRRGKGRAGSCVPGVAAGAGLGAGVRDDFPILAQSVGEDAHPLVYLDNAATSHKPRAVLEALEGYYGAGGYNSNVHRGIHDLSIRATNAYEEARGKVAAFVHARSDREIVFTRNASEAINLVAASWGSANLGPGDEVVLTSLEHHSNLVPWQLACERSGATVVPVGLNAARTGVDEAALLAAIGPKTKMVAIHHVSNTLGSTSPVAAVVDAARAVGARVLLDACQSVPHMPVDVQALGVDFLVASGHKMCAPTGIGFLWGKMDVLEAMPPFMGGGEMIRDVFMDRSTYAAPPSRFEAGTPAIAEAIGLGAAIDYLNSVGGMEAIHAYEDELAQYLAERLRSVPGATVYGPGPGEPRAALCAFTVCTPGGTDVHAHDISTLLDQTGGVAIRAGHHCTQPLHRELGINATARASCYFYNTKADVDAFIASLQTNLAFFAEVFDAPSS